MVAHIARQVRDRRVLDAMLAVPREAFVPEPVRVTAYENRPVPIGHGQTISQPLIVAIMLEALELRGHERVLDVGTGSGYQAALLGRLARVVWSVEIVPSLAETARAALDRVGASNVHVVVADGSMGWPDGGPYHAIIVAAASPHVPPALVSQLTDGGRLVLPVGGRSLQQLIRIRRQGPRLIREELGACNFVPLLGEQGVDRPRWVAAQLGAAMSTCRRAEELIGMLGADHLQVDELRRIETAIRQARAAVVAHDGELARDRAAVVAAWIEAVQARRP